MEGMQSIKKVNVGQNFSLSSRYSIGYRNHSYDNKMTMVWAIVTMVTAEK